MNRDLDTAASALGIGPRILRRKLRSMNLLSHGAELIASPQTEGRLYTARRSRWNPSINAYTEYGVVMVTEAGMEWLARILTKDTAA
ncbi:hypothetical protein [Pseudomonas sp. LRF_L74]|uniref:hypothetical protein n=1 Tax=Pseudomonas sp. LRF_L74 TaxID=3369422 RepID=UPI003F63098B